MAKRTSDREALFSAKRSRAAGNGGVVWRCNIWLFDDRGVRDSGHHRGRAAGLELGDPGRYSFRASLG